MIDRKRQKSLEVMKKSALIDEFQILGLFVMFASISLI